MIKNMALIMAAGIGERSGLGLPKQYAVMGGEVILAKTLRVFIDHPIIDYIGVVIHPDHLEYYQQVLAEMPLKGKIIKPIYGGKTRQQSVKFGLEGAASYAPKNIYIHDAARPFLKAGIIDDLSSALETHQGAAPALSILDSLCEVAMDGTIIKAADRDKIMRVQTPQAFDYQLIHDLHQQNAGEYTDDISLGIAGGLSLKLISACEDNIKLTLPSDFMYLKNTSHVPDIRTAMGYDVHRLIDGNGVILGGVLIPCPFALKGHSDADVLLHAITDAVLGGFCDGDIGAHFPPSDPKWAGKSSDHFLIYALDLLRKNGGDCHHIDATIICEKPKITPYRQVIRENIAKITGLSIKHVSIKATTTEGLGFTGRAEGIAVQSVVTTIFHKN